MTVARRKPAATLSLAAALLAALALAGCGGPASVTPTAYVHSMCKALGTWKTDVQAAGNKLQASGARTASRPVARRDYQEFVSALLTATQRATGGLRSAGVPAIDGGKRIASDLSGAFDKASRKLAQANTQAGQISTSSASTFQLGVSAVSSEIRAALQGIAAVQPSQSSALRAAAVKDSACQVLRS